MFQSILAAIDGSQRSGAALEIAIGEAKTHGAALHVVYVIETGLFSSLPMDNTWEVIYGLLEKQGEEAQLEATNRARGQGIEVTTHLKEGTRGTRSSGLPASSGPISSWWAPMGRATSTGSSWGVYPPSSSAIPPSRPWW